MLVAPAKDAAKLQQGVISSCLLDYINAEKILLYVQYVRYTNKSLVFSLPSHAIIPRDVRSKKCELLRWQCELAKILKAKV